MPDQPRPPSNPYAPPESRPSPAGEPSSLNPPVWQETTLRLGGLLGLILSLIISVIFGLRAFSQLKTLISSDESFDLWLDRVWIARMTSIQLVCLLAVTISWGLVRLRSWSRYLLTRVTVLPIPTFMVCYVFAVLLGRPRIFELPWGLVLAVVMTLPFTITILYLLWSPRKGFDSGNRKKWEGVGALPIIAALAFVFAEGVAFTVLEFSTLAILDLIGVFKP